MIKVEVADRNTCAEGCKICTCRTEDVEKVKDGIRFLEAFDTQDVNSVSMPSTLDPAIERISFQPLGASSFRHLGDKEVYHLDCVIPEHSYMAYKITIYIKGLKPQAIYTSDVLGLFFYALKNPKLTKRQYLERLLKYSVLAGLSDSGIPIIPEGITRDAINDIISGICTTQSIEIGRRIFGEIRQHCGYISNDNTMFLDISEGIFDISTNVDDGTLKLTVLHDNASLDFMTKLKEQMSMISADIESFYNEDAPFNEENFRNNVLVVKDMGARLSNTIDEVLEQDEYFRHIFACPFDKLDKYYSKDRVCYIYTIVRRFIDSIDDKTTTRNLIRTLDNQRSTINDTIEEFLREYDNSVIFRFDANALAPHENVDNE